MINKVKFSAYQLKKIVLTLPDRHPFISFAFFLPTGGNLRLSELAFGNAKFLENDFLVKVILYLNKKIKIRSDFQLVVLPECLRDYDLDMIIDHLDLPQPKKIQFTEFEPHNMVLKPQKIF